MNLCEIPFDDLQRFTRLRRLCVRLSPSTHLPYVRRRVHSCHTHTHTHTRSCSRHLDENLLTQIPTDIFTNLPGGTYEL